MNIKTQYSKFFTTIKRPSGERISVLVNEAPKYLRDFIHDVHKNTFEVYLPNDWIYEVLHEAFDALEQDELDCCSIEADVYNSELLEWMKNPFGPWFVDQAEQELGGAKDCIAQIAQGQWMAKDNIYREVNSFLEECAEDEQEDEKEGEE